MNKIHYVMTDVQEFGLTKQYITISNDCIYNNIKNFGNWEPHITEYISKNVSNGDICLDIGANFGYHTVTMANFVGNSGKVFSFEPMRIFHQQLNANICLNGLPNVTTFNCAIGDINTKVSVPEYNYFDKNNTNYGDAAISYDLHGNEVDLIQLDSLKFDSIKFIKMDIQGSELMALRGAKNSILKHKPSMIIEIEDHQYPKFKYTKQDLVTFITNDLEYDMYVMNTAYPADHLCVPKGINIDDTFEHFSLTKL